MKLSALVVALFVAAPVPVGLRGREFDHVPTRKREVALTLDAGGNAVHAWSVVRALRRRHAVATFFLTGRWVEQHRQLARVIGRSWPVANHTYDHADLQLLPDASVRSEIERAERIIRRGTRREPKPFFRFPYGSRNARTIAIANRLGYVSVRWSVDSLGWMGASGQSVDGAVRRVVGALEPGAIILMHVGVARDGSAIDTQALPRVLDGIARRGYKLTTLDRIAPGLVRKSRGR